MSTPRILVLGTRNRNKLAELRPLLEPHGLVLRTLDDFPQSVEVIEDGQTFAENAAKKAVQQALALGQWVLGEDSGLSVDALGGEPGVRSARFSGENATDEANNRHLLERLAGTAPAQRTAHYVCHMKLADPHGQIRAACEERCHGRLRLQAAGQGGFGYDPLFEILEYHRTFGELSQPVKAVLSHRGRAVRKIVPQLLQLVADGAWERVGAQKQRRVQGDDVPNPPA
jgi:XTP/dITP diphosphohydrolase